MYIDPGSLMPVVSALAAIFGALLVFWRRVMQGVRAGIRAVASKILRSPS